MSIRQIRDNNAHSINRVMASPPDYMADVLHVHTRGANGSQGVVIYGRHEFLKTRTLLATPLIVIIAAASVVGTVGNALVLTVICSNKLGRNVTTTFIMNLAMSDMFVTLIVNPMSLVGKLIIKCTYDWYGVQTSNGKLNVLCTHVCLRWPW